VKVSHKFSAGSAVFDDDHLVSCAGLVPVMTLAEQTGLGRLVGEKVHIAEPKIKSGAVNPAPKLATLIAGMCAGADCIDDVDALRSGGMKTLFGAVYAPSTIGTLLREFTFGPRVAASALADQVLAVDEGNVEAEDLLTAPGDAGEIRRLTILFADMVDSTVSGHGHRIDDQHRRVPVVGVLSRANAYRTR
jgi:hypothetical protein